MIDSLIVGYPFLEAGLKLPVYQMGKNLSRGINHHLLPMFNGMFIKRSDYSNLETLTYANQIEILLRDKENMVIYPEGTRSKDGKVAPIQSKKRYFLGKEKETKAMGKGFLAPILRTVHNKPDDLYYCVMTVSAPIFPDILEYKTNDGRVNNNINTFGRLFCYRDFKHVDTGIHIHFCKPQVIKAGTENTSLNRKRIAKAIRSDMKENIKILPENIMAYGMEYLKREDKDMEDLKKIFFSLHEYVQNRHNLIIPDPDESWNLAKRFYNKVNFPLLVGYNSNRVQHFFKKDLPLRAYR